MDVSIESDSQDEQSSEFREGSEFFSVFSNIFDRYTVTILKLS